MPYLAMLQAASTVADVASLLGYQTSVLTYILYSKVAPPKFTTFQIAKKSGGMRTIEAPNPRLKGVQRRLSDVLQDCEDEIRRSYGRHDEGPRADKVTHGFVRRRSIITNAYQHRRQKLVFNVDLDDFFPSINFGRVRGFFIRDKNFLLQPAVATVLAQIACAGNHLPQGSPCSPVIANLIGHILDVHLVRLAASNGCRYTRYADDLTFSTNKRTLPPTIAVRLDGKEHQWAVGATLAHLIKRCGFRVNTSKTRMQYRASRQEVTGLVVNEKVNVRSDYRHAVRAMVHRLFMTGSFEVDKTIAPSGAGSAKAPGTLPMLHGMLAFIDSVDLYNRRLTPQSGAVALSSKELTYRRFLLFKDFYAAPEPVLVCEGKTDNVYLTHAIRSLAKLFPKLATINAAGKVTIGVRRYRYTDRSTGRILGIGGGDGDLRKLLLTYRDALGRFRAPGLGSPVIVLIDNDSAAQRTLATIKQIVGSEPDRTAPFIHVVANMYVVLTPLLPGAKTSMIEDLFDAATRAIKFNGKSFDPANQYSTASSYGKADFAYNVIQPNADTIDFSGFEPLLRNLSLVVEAHANRGAP